MKFFLPHLKTRILIAIILAVVTAVGYIYWEDGHLVHSYWDRDKEWYQLSITFQIYLHLLVAIPCVFLFEVWQVIRRIFLLVSNQVLEKRMRQLNELKEAGIITQDEYDKKLKELKTQAGY